MPFDQPFFGSVEGLEIARDPHHLMMNVADTPFAQFLAQLAVKQQWASRIDCATMLRPTLLPASRRDTDVKKSVIRIGWPLAKYVLIKDVGFFRPRARRDEKTSRSRKHLARFLHTRYVWRSVKSGRRRQEGLILHDVQPNLR